MIAKIGRALALTLVVGACRTEKPAVPFRALDTTYGEAPAAFKSSVKQHALHGAVTRDAIARGDLEAAHHAAHELVQLVLESERPAPQTRVGEMVDAARRVEAAKDLNEAARTFAVLAERCGACHTAFGGPRSFPSTPPPDEVALGPQMRRHQWAAARLWEGLVAPSDEAWTSGARVLSDAPFDFAAPRAGKRAGGDEEKLAADLHALGVKGVSTAGAARVDLYGAVLTTCAGCHQHSGGGPSGPRE